MVTYGSKVGKVCPRMPILVHATFVYSFPQDLKALTSTLAVRYTFGFLEAFLWPFLLQAARPWKIIGFLFKKIGLEPLPFSKSGHVSLCFLHVVLHSRRRFLYITLYWYQIDADPSFLPSEAPFFFSSFFFLCKHYLLQADGLLLKRTCSRIHHSAAIGRKSPTLPTLTPTTTSNSQIHAYSHLYIILSPL